MSDGPLWIVGANSPVAQMLIFESEEDAVEYIGDSNMNLEAVPVEYVTDGSEPDFTDYSGHHTNRTSKSFSQMNDEREASNFEI